MGLGDQGLNRGNTVTDSVLGLDLHLLFLVTALLLFEWENLAGSNLDNQILFSLELLSWDFLQTPNSVL